MAKTSAYEVTITYTVSVDAKSNIEAIERACTLVDDANIEPKIDVWKKVN